MKLRTLLTILPMIMFPIHSHATGWSWNIGYHNPPTAPIGLNFMYSWTNFALELGIGNIDSRGTSTNSNNSSSTSGSSNTTESNTVTVGGDLNLKYQFGTGWLRPYLQIGTMLGTAVNNSGAGAGTGTNFWGGGLMMKGNPFYFYIGANSIANTTDGHAGLGFDF